MCPLERPHIRTNEYAHTHSLSHTVTHLVMCGMGFGAIVKQEAEELLSIKLAQVRVNSGKGGADIPSGDILLCLLLIKDACVTHV